MRVPPGFNNERFATVINCAFLIYVMKAESFDKAKQVAERAMTGYRV